MRANRLLALALLLFVPLSRSAAQTCQGMAAFQDGRMRGGFDDQGNSDFNGVRGTLEYGLPTSIFGGFSLGALHVSGPGSSSEDLGMNLGYQIRIGETPFQFCPAVSLQYSWDFSWYQVNRAFGGSLGYRIDVADWLAVVPAAGAWLISTRTQSVGHVQDLADQAPGPSATGSSAPRTASSQIFLTTGLVFKKAFTISPGVIVPSQGSVKPVYTLGVSMNWSAPAHR